MASHLLRPVVCLGRGPTLPGGLPITALLPEYGSLPAEHSGVWPGESVFGYGLTWIGPCSSPARCRASVYGLLRRARLAARGVVDHHEVEAQRGAVADGSDSMLAMLRRNSVT